MKTSVLLIDSDADFKGRVTAILRDKGYAVFEADTFKRAEAILSSEPIEIVCVESRVAGERCLPFLYRLHRAHASCQVALVSHPDQDGDEDALSGDFPHIDLLLFKPISPEEMVYKLDVLSDLQKLDAHHKKISTKPLAPVMEEPPSLKIQQAELRTSYAEKVPRLFADLGSRLIEASRSDDSYAAMEEAHRIAHMLNGTAGSLGFSDVSTAMHAMECAIKEMLRIRRMTSMPATMPFGNADRLSPHDTGIVLSPQRVVTATVLFVDDDEDFLNSIVVMGTENLIKVHKATNRAEALFILKEHHVDAAIIDIILPNGENAFDLAKALRETPGYATLPTGFISVDTSIAKRVGAVHAGASLFLDKPLMSETFAAAVRRLVPLESRSRQRILIIDDDPDFVAHLSLLLEPEGIDVASLNSAADIVEQLSELKPDLLLLDVVMDKVNGLDACRILRSMEEWRDLPILVLTVYGNRDMLLRCFEAGADDYIEKPIIKEELLARIRLRIERIRMFKERADTDALTGLPTRRPFLGLLKMRLSEGIRFHKPVSLCLLDLDFFKKVNDTYGHLAGDRVLSAFGRLLNSRFRTMDVRGRWGGEEFAVAFYGEDADTAKMIINRVLEELKQVVFVGDHGEEFHVSFSAGIATFPTAGKSVDELFRCVDRNLYLAKEKGRGRIEI